MDILLNLLPKEYLNSWKLLGIFVANKIALELTLNFEFVFDKYVESVDDARLSRSCTLIL